MAGIGYLELLAGDIIGAVVILFESYYGDWFITLLFLSFKIMLWFTSRSPMLGFVMSLIFISVFYTTINPLVLGTVVAFAVFELGAILYSLIFKK